MEIEKTPSVRSLAPCQTQPTSQPPTTQSVSTFSSRLRRNSFALSLSHRPPAARTASPVPLRSADPAARADPSRECRRCCAAHWQQRGRVRGGLGHVQTRVRLCSRGVAPSLRLGGASRRLEALRLGGATAWRRFEALGGATSRLATLGGATAWRRYGLESLRLGVATLGGAASRYASLRVATLAVACSRYGGDGEPMLDWATFRLPLTARLQRARRTARRGADACLGNLPPPSDCASTASETGGPTGSRDSARGLGRTGPVGGRDSD